MRNTWWKNPYRWLDTDDLKVIGNAPKDKRHYVAALMVIEHLCDRGTHRPLENTTFARLFKATLDNVDLDELTLTSRQREIMRLYNHAIRQGLVPATYISNIEGITPQAALRTIKRAQTRKMVQMGDLLTLDSKQPEPNYAPIPLNKIRQVQKRLRVRCAGDGLPDCQGWAWGDKAVCPSCYQQAFDTDWLFEHRKFVLRESYAEAKAIIERGSDDSDSAVTYERMADAA